MPKILAIDDRQDNLIVLRAVLRNFLPETVVFTAQTGPNGLDLARTEQPDVILLDLVMPGMDGYAVCTALKTDAATQHIPIIMLTALKADAASRIKALHTGADAFLSKPVDEAELAAQVKAMLRIKRAEDRLRAEKELLEQRVQERTQTLQHELNERKRAEEALRASEARVKLKLDAILSPEGDLGTLALADIIDSEALQSLMNNFFTLTQIGIGIIDIHGKILVATGWQDICTQYHRVHPETHQYCLESDTLLAAGVASGTFKVYRCKNNLWDMVTPIMIGGKHLGNLFLGQFFFTDEVVDEDFFRSQARQYGFDETAYLAALKRVPRWSQATVKTVMTFYTEFAHMVSILSHSNLKLARMVTERDALLDSLRESEEKYRLAMEATTDGIWDWNIPTGAMYYSPAWGLILGETAVPPEYAFWESRLHPEDRAVVLHSLTEHWEGKRARWEQEHRLRTTSGAWKWVLGRGTLVARDQHGNPLRMVGTLLDLSERKQAEERLNAALDEKTILLREVHHRTRNNMQVMSALLHFQAKTITDDRVLRLFQDAQGRLDAMALVHHKLHQTDLTTVNLQAYIPDLIHMLLMSYQSPPGRIRLTLEIAPVLMTIDAAVPFGLMFNEVISNVLKHAFPDGKPGELCVRLQTTADGLKDLWVCDNGVGLPEEFNLRETKAVGFHLVKMIVERQFQGTVTVENNAPGAAVHIRFKEIPYEKRI